MAANGGRHRFGPGGGRLTLRTYRSGLAAQAGHDLTIEVTRWSGELDGDDRAPRRLEAQIDMGSLQIREGIGGVKPLTDRDRREIAATARKQLEADRYPEATFVAGAVRAGRQRRRHDQRHADPARPDAAVRLNVSQNGDGRYRAAGDRCPVRVRDQAVLGHVRRAETA